MKLNLLILITLTAIAFSQDIAPELKENVLRFPYGVLFKYVGKLTTNVERVWVVNKVELPKISDIDMKPIEVDVNCSHFRKHISGIIGAIYEKDQPRLIDMCNQLMVIVKHYVNKHKFYNISIHQLIEKEIPAVLPKIHSKDRNKRSIIGPIISGIIGIAHETISYFLKRKRDNAMRKAYHALNTKQNIMKNELYQHNKDLLMYGQFSLDTLDHIVDTINDLHARTVKVEKMFQKNSKDLLPYFTPNGFTDFTWNSLLNSNVLIEKHLTVSAALVDRLQIILNGLRLLARGYLPITLIPPTKLTKILHTVENNIRMNNPGYTLALKNPFLYYDMKLVTFGVDSENNLIIQYPVWVKKVTQKPYSLYQLESTSVPIIDENLEADSYTEVKFSKPYIAFSNLTYINIRTQELRQCKKVSTEYFCEELFLVKDRSKHSCESALYFNLSTDIIKQNCNFQYYFNKTVVPAVLDNGNQIVLANLANPKKLVCKNNNNFPWKMENHPYVLVNRSILCHCQLTSQFAYLQESLAACPHDSQQTVVMYFTINLAF